MKKGKEERECRTREKKRRRIRVRKQKDERGTKSHCWKEKVLDGLPLPEAGKRVCRGWEGNGRKPAGKKSETSKEKGVEKNEEKGGRWTRGKKWERAPAHPDYFMLQASKTLPERRKIERSTRGTRGRGPRYSVIILISLRSLFSRVCCCFAAAMNLLLVRSPCYVLSFPSVSITPLGIIYGVCGNGHWEGGEETKTMEYY